MRTADGRPVAVVGAGAVGCYFGAMLARAGQRVKLVGRAPHVAAISSDGLLFDGLRQVVREFLRVNSADDTVPGPVIRGRSWASLAEFPGAMTVSLARTPSQCPAR